MKLSISQIEKLLPIISAVDIDGEKFTDVSFRVGNIADMGDDDGLIDLSYTDADLLYEDVLTPSDLLTAEVELDGTLVLADGRSVMFFTENQIDLAKL